MASTLAAKAEQQTIDSSAALDVAQPKKDVIAKVRDSQGEFAKALPAHIDPARFTRVAITALRSSEKLRACDPTTVLAGIMTAAQLGLEINDVRGQSYLIPRWNGKTSRNEASFQLGYRGLIDLAARNGLTVNAQIVREGDTLTFDLATLEASHTFSLTTKRGPVVGYYCRVLERGEARNLVVWTVEQAEEHRDRFASSKTKAGEVYGPWKDHFDAMALKSTIRAALNTMPLSVELRDALNHDGGIAIDFTGDPLPEADYIDADSEELPVDGAA
jgi:recombination protein RecT